MVHVGAVGGRCDGVKSLSGSTALWPVFGTRGRCNRDGERDGRKRVDEADKVNESAVHSEGAWLLVARWVEVVRCSWTRGVDAITGS